MVWYEDGSSDAYILSTNDTNETTGQTTIQPTPSPDTVIDILLELDFAGVKIGDVVEAVEQDAKVQRNIFIKIQKRIL